MLEVAQEVEAVVLDIDPRAKRIALGRRRIEQNPWTVIENKYPIGSVIKGIDRNRNVTGFAVFVGVEHGVDGLVHVPGGRRSRGAGAGHGVPDHVQDEGLGARKYADDRDWTLELDWLDDGDEASRLGGPTVIGLSGATSVAQGEPTFGYGKVRDRDQYFKSSSGLRGINDYDAYDTDRDLFQFDFGGAMGDQGWELSWELLHPDGGTAPPGDIALEFTFCGAGPAADGGLCAGAQQRILGFNDQSLTPWYLPQSVSNGRTLFSRVSTTTSTTITVLPVVCACFSASRTAAGSYFANIAAIDRTSNDPIRYRVSQRLVAYPGNFTGPDGGAATCPVVDGGCGFAR